LWVIAVAVATDCGAYVVGRMVGGAKLAPRISPGKTWAGAFGGLAFGAAAGALMPLADSLGGAMNAVLASLGASVVAQLGDLIESAFKRQFGVKDMGTLFPGHGGLADRLDSVMGTMIAVAIGYFLSQHGVAAW
jgi:phosphatidate cytidylyltransferase